MSAKRKSGERAARGKAPAVRRAPSPDVAVIGAGAFGGWTAWHLTRRGARVALVDAWGAGHPRGTSSGEARILRFSYGEKHLYSEWTHRARAIWRKCEQDWGVPLFVNCGMLWLFREENDYYRASIAALEKLREPWQKLGTREMTARFPQFALDAGEFALFEPGSGILRAQRAVQTVAAHVQRLGGTVLTGWVEPPVEGGHSGPSLQTVRIRSGDGGAASELRAGAFVFACGPWLPQLFPELLGRRIVVTKQDVFYFGPPAGDARFEAPQMPAWADYDPEFYGTPGTDVCGFKLADNQGPPGFDPTSGERVTAPETERAAREYLARRFPAMAGAPLVRSRVCQYERTPDSHVVVDRHPRWDTVWLAGGGSGHGFKFSPALGEFLAGLVLEGGQEKIAPPLRLLASVHHDTSRLRRKGAY
jgi:glycine/D-amino acid oxidase-like deaminating enzyme